MTCILLNCNLSSTCQRWKDVMAEQTGRTYVPEMPFTQKWLKRKGAKNPAINWNQQPVNGCVDYWPVGTGPEYFTDNVGRKTPKM